MSKIKKVENQPNFPQLEERINSFWNEKKIFEKSVEQRSVENTYSFLDGPPFPSGMPHYGHLLMSVAKDVIPRYQTMKGKRVRRVFGWDCHGIAVEAKVNKELGISNRREIEEYGIENYVKECRKYVENCIANWRWYIDKVGRWVDMDNPYYTMYPEYHESVLWAFKQMWDKGHIYKGKRVSLFSVETGTPVSDFEVAEGNDYRDIEDLSIFVKFKLTDHTFETEAEGNPVNIVAWTTTPWTIPSNTALAVNPEVDYCLVKFEGQYLVVAKNRLEYTFHTTEEHIGTDNGKLVQVLKEFKGLGLEGLSYESVYDFFADKKVENDYKIYLYEGVTVEDGTGVLHVAPAFGEEDFNLGKEHGLSDHRDIDEEGKMSVGKWKGTYLRDASAMIAEDLNEKGNLLRSLPYVHRLPFYRGSEPLIYMAQDSYFINLQDKKERMLELNQNINWIPGNIKTGRFPAIIESAPDWCISRNRYWATIMPLWRSEDGDEIVVGGFEEMMQYTDKIEKKVDANGRAEYFVNGEKLSAHRDKCDALVFTKDGKEYHRVQEVLDVWLDSGAAPFAEHHYPFENKDLFEKNLKEKGFVNDFIVEGAGMVRAWFNVLHRVSTLVFDTNSFENVICAGTFAGNDGRKMSKTYGNYTDPKDVLENLGGETLRLYMMGSAVMGGGEANWSDELLKEMQKNILIPVWNTYKYLSIYAELHNWSPENTEFDSTNVLDVWLKNYMDKVSLEYSVALESYDIPASVKLIQPTIDNISSWWIRRSRDRFVKGDPAALQTLYASLVQFIKTFAPQMPFVCEEMYQNLVVGAELSEAKESVHLELYPEVSKDAVDQSLLDQMELVRKVCSLGLSIRVENALKVRQPLSELKIKSEELKMLNPDLLDIVRDELNVKAVTMVDELDETEGWLMKTQEELSVALNTEITQKLKEEGLLNELVRQLQNFRKESGLQMGEVVELHYFTSEVELRDVIDLNKEKIMKSISMSDIKFMDDLEGKEVKVDEKVMVLHVVK
jgi:isoleucyl-tRNA synthetase